ncbi:MAG: heavy metal translocating P-type ATPase [Alphaproteobacteria bacterium]|nr:heavy metal translocating P-type ATPase [Alphaproteobacteria bacterium]
MDCIEEVTILRKVLSPIVGNEDKLSFDVLNGRMGVNDDKVSDADIIKAVSRTGMKAEVVTAGKEPQDAGSYRKYATMLMVVSGLFTTAGFLVDAYTKGSLMAAFQEGGKMPAAAIGLYIAAITAGGWFVMPKAIYALRGMRPDMNLLMVIAVLGAAGIGEWFEAATVTFLFSLSLSLEAWSIGRARRAIAALMSLAPETARLKQDGGEKEVPAGEVKVGDTFIVLGGERIPLDGKVTRGESHVNQAPITGESVPVRKEVGAEVFAGTINGDSTLEIAATKTSDNTTLANIIRLVGEAQNKRAPSEQWVEKFARIYTPAVILLAVAVFVIPVIMGLSASAWFYKALVLLVIACPCALVISTPVSIVSSLTAAAKAGVLIKGGVHVETPGRLKALALDKTGTITEGRPTVAEVIALSGHSEEELMARASALEARSTHPLATAVIEYAQKKNVKVESAEDVAIIPGKGVTGHFQGKVYWLGSERYLQERKQETPEVKAMIAKISGAGRTVIVIGNDTHVCGLVAVVDAIRPAAKAALARLRELGIEHLVMLSGDNKATAESIAKSVGIDEVHAELLPEDKVTAIDGLVKKYQSVGMIGDGVNDAPAMGRASLGIAMGAVGSDAAIESADIALMADDLSKLPWLISHSRRTLSIIKQNIALSLLTKGAFILLNLAGMSTLWIAIAADMGTTLVVIMNSLRLLSTSEKTT